MLRATGCPGATPGEKRADQRCSAISFWTRHPPNWARHRVDHGTITGRGGDKFGPRKAVFACNGCAFSPRPPPRKNSQGDERGGTTEMTGLSFRLQSLNEARAPVGVRGLCRTRLQGVGGWGDFLPWARHLMAPTNTAPKSAPAARGFDTAIVALARDCLDASQIPYSCFVLSCRSNKGAILCL